MRTSRQFGILFLLVFMAACSTPSRDAYRTIGSIAVTVDIAKRAFYDYRATGKVTPQIEAKAKEFYVAYQKAMFTAEAAQRSIATTKDEAPFYVALAALVGSANELVDFVRTVVPTFKPK